MAPQGISLHIGLNSVDPTHYGGWAGTLQACEADALSMRAVAASQGFRSNLLLTQQARAERVIGAINDAARILSSGDIFFLSYSGHGAQVSDTNGGDEDDGLDETWVLYDRMLIDDELYNLWARFRQGVRIVVLSDSCHSGTVLRAMPTSDVILPLYSNLRTGDAVRENAKTAVAEDSSIRFRAMPQGVQDRTYQRHRELYEDLQRRIPAGDRAAVKAGIILLSGCQDNQLSLDGIQNGLFTSKLLQVWDDGRFMGNYRQFYREIKKRMPTLQTPNYLTVGVTPSEFENARPFAVALTVPPPVTLPSTALTPALPAGRPPANGVVVSQPPAGVAPGDPNVTKKRRVTINIRVT